ncbi:uncharacterized protein LOC124141485 isoform X1 [Haliotis rufescens]|uniref:uncharacterized protein LOC124141485 isoform X1 n=2 Tax=Haliotis rufescens TaxID=6454 RepID=UPI001EB03395|nr:uncharacterized protein LOC124141485 isoform X1 [Haliotis rufescens]
MDTRLLEINGRGINIRTGSITPRRFMGVVSRSAPMTRCVGQPNMSLSYKRNICTPGDIKTLSVDDIYLLAEKERARSSYRNRRHVLELAQKDVRRDDGLSRPHSSASRILHKQQSLTPSIDPRDGRSRISSAQSTLKPNTPDPDDELLDEMRSSHSCEVMGPSACEECRKSKSRAKSRDHADASFPSLRVTQQNITTSTLVKRLYPGMSNTDIQTKIARGEIARSHLPKALQCHPVPHKKPDEDDDSTRREKLKQNEKTAFTIARLKHKLKRGTPSTPMYFHNIRDLNYKIMSGKVPRELGFSNVSKSHASKKNETRRESTVDSLFPVFVSPRKVTMYKEPSYKTYFGPPLLPRASQKPEPSFFAGSDFEYKLPERLPDKLVFVDTMRQRLHSAISLASSAVSDDTHDTESQSIEKLEITE